MAVWTKQGKVILVGGKAITTLKCCPNPTCEDIGMESSEPACPQGSKTFNACDTATNSETGETFTFTDTRKCYYSSPNTGATCEDFGYASSAADCSSITIPACSSTISSTGEEIITDVELICYDCGGGGDEDSYYNQSPFASVGPGGDLVFIGDL
jgi:hypothetical protein